MIKENGKLIKVTKEDLNDPNLWDDVTAIGSFCFFEVNFCGKDLIVPEGIKELDINAFSGCKNINTIVLPESIDYIGNDAFAFNRDLKEVKMPKTIENMGRAVFSHCYNLRKVTIPDGVTTLGTGMFSDCPVLEEVNLPDSINTICDCTFSNCSSLKSIDLPKNLQAIHHKVFQNCESLKSIDIPDSVSNLGIAEFYNCENLKSVKLPENIYYIPSEFFLNCKRLEDVAMPENLKFISARTFKNCSELKTIDLPNALSLIGESAFENCKSLKNLDIPDNCTIVQIGAFSNCKSLQSVQLSQDMKVIDALVFAGCKNLKEIEIPESVTEIKDKAFYNCSLSDVELPKNLQVFDMDAFGNNKDLKYMKIKGEKTASLPFYGDVKFDKNLVMEFNFDNENLSLMAINSKNEFNHVYLDRNKKFVIISPYEIKELKNRAYDVPINIKHEIFANNDNLCLDSKNYRNNYVDIKKKLEADEIKFMPQDYLLSSFPNSQLDNFIVNHNYRTYGKLVKNLGLDTLDDINKTTSLTSLFKIYYAIGGFSENTGDRDNAYDYIINHVAKLEGDETPTTIGEELHRRFSGLVLNGHYNPKFASFFMKYYKDNKNFMCVNLNENYEDDEDEFDDIEFVDMQNLDSMTTVDQQDYLCQAHNSFDDICKRYPYMTVYGNNKRSVLTPEFVARNSVIIEYEGIDEDSKKLAIYLGNYGYSQEDFDKCKKILSIARKIKDEYTIKGGVCEQSDKIQYRFLEKDDPIGFVIGNMTNCCQHLNDNGETCVCDGYQNKDAGFLVFERKEVDKSGEQTGRKIIMGQAYIWYDPITKTVCYDNIEVPTKVLENLEKASSNESIEDFLGAINKSGISILKEMNKDELKVEKVTVGEMYNDLKKYLDGRYSKITSDLPKHRHYTGYSDAICSQYVIKNYKDLLASEEFER